MGARPLRFLPRSIGELCDRALPSTTIVNGYGPTEATTFSTYHVIPRVDQRRTSIPIGRPVRNTSIYAIAYTIGGMMVFPATKINRKPTINGGRGLDKQIADRFDLTLECIRRHYFGPTQPTR